jgi:hypothetical protein
MFVHRFQNVQKATKLPAIANAAHQNVLGVNIAMVIFVIHNRNVRQTNMPIIVYVAMIFAELTKTPKANT